MPNLQKLGALRIGENVKEQLLSDLKLEEEAVDNLKKAIETCIKERDYTSRDLLEKILNSEEDHIDWIESQLHVIKEIGLENYLAEHIKKHED
jgi:bacterioferritin